MTKFLRILINAIQMLSKSNKSSQSIKWRSFPGCFERHLQRRHNNALFSPDRRVISQDELTKARKRDDQELAEFQQKYATLEKKLIKRINDRLSLSEIKELLDEVQELILNISQIGRHMGESNKNLLIYEEALMRMIPDSTSETKELLEKYLSLARIERHPFLAQSVRKDSPILKDEQIPTLLSEDMQTIQDMGNIFSRMDTMRPNRVDIEVFLANAVADGYSKVKADKFLKAWDAGGRNSCNA